MQTLISCKLDFNQSYYTFTLLILIKKIVVCSKFPGSKFMNYKCFDVRFALESCIPPPRDKSCAVVQTTTECGQTGVKILSIACCSLMLLHHPWMVQFLHNFTAKKILHGFTLKMDVKFISLGRHAGRVGNGSR